MGDDTPTRAITMDPHSEPADDLLPLEKVGGGARYDDCNKQIRRMESQGSLDQTHSGVEGERIVGGSSPNHGDSDAAAHNPTKIRRREDNKLDRWIHYLLLKTALNPKFPLRRQLFLSFGLTACLGLSLFVCIGIITTHQLGASVMAKASAVQQDLVRHTVGTSARYTAEAITKTLNQLGTASAIIEQVVLDRFAGYSNRHETGEGSHQLRIFESDQWVPFVDRDTGKHQYPLHTPHLMIHDWEIPPSQADLPYQTDNIPDCSHPDTLRRDRRCWYTPALMGSTARAAYFQQGDCDPRQSTGNTDHPAYYPNCTIANTNWQTGGVVQPVRTSAGISSKAHDIVWVLKALYESHHDAYQLGMYFANGGAGSAVTFPAQLRDVRPDFTSIGCQWMTAPNPNNNRSLATDLEISRCHSVGAGNTTQRFPGREYNPLERPWCARQALSAGATVTTGPYLDSNSGERLWVLTLGKGVFDRATNEFLGCTLMDVTVHRLGTLMEGIAIGKSSQVALIRWEDPFAHLDGANDISRAGTVVAATTWDLTMERQVAFITDPKLRMGVDEDMWQRMLAWVDFDQPWDPEELKQLFQHTIFRQSDNSGKRPNEERLVMMYPVPYIPPSYDPNYHPEFMVIMSILESEVMDAMNDMAEQIDRDSSELTRNMLLVAFAGLILVFLLLSFLSRTLTKPLHWMQRTTAQVIMNAGFDDEEALTKAATKTHADTNAGRVHCSPRTEVNALLSEFEMMMDGFSGKGAAEVADAVIKEVENKFVWREDYQELYPYKFFCGNSSYTDNCKADTDTPPGTHQTDEDGSDRQRKPDDSSSTQSETDGVEDTGKPGFALAGSASDSYFQAFQENLANTVYDSFSAVVDWGYKAKKNASVRNVLSQIMTIDDDENDGIPDYVVQPPKIHVGPNLKPVVHADPSTPKRLVEVPPSSRLFWSTAFMIGTPILVTAFCLVGMVDAWIRSALDTWLVEVSASSYTLEKDTIVTASLARAAFGNAVMARFVRDLHVYARVAGWLLWRGLQRSDSFTEMYSFSERCKYSESGRCSALADIPCDCAWDDPVVHLGLVECQNITLIDEFLPDDSRSLQVLSYDAESDGADSVTGDRFNSSFPLLASSPEETNWWTIDDMPGAQRGVLASGFNTTYDRVRVLSATSVSSFPLYNYFPGLDEQKTLGTYVGTEADGIMLGYSGCSAATDYPSWQSNDENKGYLVQPDLCPKGKYGYDPRCRDWYAKGLERGFYISPPYQFASLSLMGTSISSILKDRKTGEVAGVALLDFLPSSFINALGPNSTAVGQGEHGFPFIVTASEDINGGDTVIGPAYQPSDGPQSIVHVILDEDENGGANQENFRKNVLSKMRAGATGNTTFMRMQDGVEEEVFIAYAPVSVRILEPVSHADFAQGCKASDELVYSLGIAIVESDLRLPYQRVASSVGKEADTARVVSIVLLVVSAILFVFMTYYISLAITRPILALTRIVKCIKNKSLGEELPDVDGGSIEVLFLHDTFQRLIKVVKYANTAFFAGDRTQSYNSMTEALNLFVRVGNQKAMGIALNNLGTMVLQEQLENHGSGRLFDNSMFGVCISEIYTVGMGYFDEAIRNGLFEYELAVDTIDRGAFAKQLANRYFNRGMFLVVMKGHPLCPDYVVNDGISDLLQAKNYDDVNRQFNLSRMILDEGDDKFILQEFESVLRRARGLLLLVRNWNFKAEEVWNIESLIQQLDEMVKTDNQALLRDVSRVGRSQQVNDLRVQYALLKNEYRGAAKIAMKILVEDEYVIDTVIVNAMTAVNQYFKSTGSLVPTINANQYLQRETRRAQVNTLREAKNVMFCLDYSGSMAGDRMSRVNKNLRWVYNEHCSDKDLVGFIRFNHVVDTDLWFPLARKGDYKEMQEYVLSRATNAEGGTRLYSALNQCVTMICGTETINDTWIIAMTDGESSWDHSPKVVRKRIQKWNKKSKHKIHVIVIGYEVPQSVVENCQKITSVTKQSLYIDARGGLDEMDKAFEQVVSIIGGNAITMETF